MLSVFPLYTFLVCLVIVINIFLQGTFVSMNQCSLLVQWSPQLSFWFLQCCFQVVKFPAKVTWDATGDRFWAQLRRQKTVLLDHSLLICQSLISHYNVSRKPGMYWACHLRDSLRISFGKGLCWIFFSSVFMNFLTLFCTVPILCLPRGNMNCSILLASYFLNTCGNTFQGAVQLTFPFRWTNIAAAALTTNWLELKECEAATNLRARKIWLDLSWKISHNT